MSISDLLLPLLVSVSTWMTAAPHHAEGLIVLYGNDHLAKANAEYRGYDLSKFKQRCGLAVMSPSDLGKVVWVKDATGEWYGPCLAVDVGARHDFYDLIYVKHEVAEVTETLAKRLRFPHGSSIWGEIFIGQCPPPIWSEPREYRPKLVFDNSPTPYREWNKQQYPIECKQTDLKQ